MVQQVIFMLGAIKTVSPDLTAGYFGRLMGWVDRNARNLQVRTNADTPRDAKQARDLWCRRYWSMPY